MMFLKIFVNLHSLPFKAFELLCSNITAESQWSVISSCWQAPHNFVVAAHSWKLCDMAWCIVKMGGDAQSVSGTFNHHFDLSKWTLMWPSGDVWEWKQSLCWSSWHNLCATAWPPLTCCVMCSKSLQSVQVRLKTEKSKKNKWHTLIWNANLPETCCCIFVISNRTCMSFGLKMKCLQRNFPQSKSEWGDTTSIARNETPICGSVISRVHHRSTLCEIDHQPLCWHFVSRVAVCMKVSAQQSIFSLRWSPHCFKIQMLKGWCAARN